MSADDELLLWSGGGLSELGAGAVDWVQVRGPNSYDVDAPIAWTGESVLARGWQQVDHRLFTFLAQWDGASGAWELLPQAPRDIDYGFVWADGRLLVLGADLIYDIDTRTWWEMTLPDSVDDYGDVAVWAGDRLFVWGGASDKGTPAHEVAFVLTPDL